MEITILVDQDMLGFDTFLEEGLKETGWDQLIQFHLRRPHDCGLPANLPDQDIWRFVQENRLLLITNNRNNEDETSLQATMRRENTLESWPIITVSDKNALIQSDYRQRVAHRLAEIIVDLENYLGTGRLFVP